LFVILGALGIGLNGFWYLNQSMSNRDHINARMALDFDIFLQPLAGNGDMPLQINATDAETQLYLLLPTGIGLLI